MATQNSSLIGANLSGAANDATALFALGTTAFGTGDSEWVYVEVTSTLNTGKLVTINPNGTAKVLTSARFTAFASGLVIAAAQGQIDQGQFGWVATRGVNLYILTSASLTAGTYDKGYGIGANSGRIIAGTNIAAGNTLFGVWVTSSVGTADHAPGVPTLATIMWPRMGTVN
jgi:hypothetical protein